MKIQPQQKQPIFPVNQVARNSNKNWQAPVQFKFSSMYFTVVLQQKMFGGLHLTRLSKNLKAKFVEIKYETQILQLLLQLFVPLMLSFFKI